MTAILRLERHSTFGGSPLPLLFLMLSLAGAASAQAPAAGVPPADWQAVQQELGRLHDQLEAQQQELEYHRSLIEPWTDAPPRGSTHHNEEFRSELLEDTPLFRLGGQYRVIYNSANFDFHPPVITDRPETVTLFNQRFRSWFSVNPNEHVQGYLQVEMGHIIWGESYDFPKTYAVQGDRVGMELRRGYLTYRAPAGSRWRVGIQDWHDAFGEHYALGAENAVDNYDSFGAVLANSIWDFNVGGLSYTRTFEELGDFNVNAGGFVLAGQGRGFEDAYLAALDLDWPRDEQRSVGVSFYHVADQGDYSYPTADPYDSAWNVWMGVRAKTLLVDLPVAGFAIYNTGRRRGFAPGTDFSHGGVALKLATGPFPLPWGSLEFQTLYADAGFRTIAQSARDDFGAQGYWSYLLLSSPHGPSDVNDLGVSLQNRGLGLLTAQGTYNYPISDRLSGALAGGWFQSAADNPSSGSRAMGTEIAKTWSADLGGGLTTDLGAAVFFTGDFYRAGPAAASPATLWQAFTRVQLEF